MGVHLENYSQSLNSEAIHNFCVKWRINELSVFGSVLRTDFRPDSDIDFLADFDEGAEWDLLDHMDMEEELSSIVGRDVDLLTRYSVENSDNRCYKQRILGTAESIFARR